MTTLPEPYDAYCARMADEYAAESGWTEGDLDEADVASNIRQHEAPYEEPTPVPSPFSIERYEDGYILNHPDGTWHLFWTRREAEAQARKEGLMPDDGPPPPPPAARVVAVWVGLLAAADGRRGVDSRQSRDERRRRAFVRCA